MRIEPPVSEPRPMKAAPVATDTPRPRTSRPGCAACRGRRGWRRAVVRVDADAGEGELGHVGAADDHAAGGAQARHGRARRARRGASTSATEPAVVTSPATSNRSLIDTGRPASGHGRRRLLGRGRLEAGLEEDVGAGGGLAAADPPPFVGGGARALAQALAGAVEVGRAAWMGGVGGGPVLESRGFAGRHARGVRLVVSKTNRGSNPSRCRNHSELRFWPGF